MQVKASEAEAAAAKRYEGPCGSLSFSPRAVFTAPVSLLPPFIPSTTLTHSSLFPSTHHPQNQSTLKKTRRPQCCVLCMYIEAARRRWGGEYKRRTTRSARKEGREGEERGGRLVLVWERHIFDGRLW